VPRLRLLFKRALAPTKEKMMNTLPQALTAALPRENTVSPVIPRRGLRRAAAIGAGFFSIVGLSVGTDAVLHATGVFPPSGQVMSSGSFLLAVLYRTLYAVGGCYVAARIAPDRRLAHALTLGGIGFVISLLGVLASMQRGPEFGPLWYPLAVAVSALPSAWLGGRFALLHVARNAE
jgi:hypothetical protein